MRLSVLDQMIDQALADLASGESDRVNGLVRKLASDWPNQPALSVSFALSSAAASLEDLVDVKNGSTNLAYRLAALVAADVLAVEALGQAPAQTQNLLHFWRRAEQGYLQATA